MPNVEWNSFDRHCLHWIKYRKVFEYNGPLLGAQAQFRYGPSEAASFSESHCQKPTYTVKITWYNSIVHVRLIQIYLALDLSCFEVDDEHYCEAHQETKEAYQKQSENKWNYHTSTKRRQDWSFFLEQHRGLVILCHFHVTAVLMNWLKIVFSFYFFRFVDSVTSHLFTEGLTHTVVRFCYRDFLFAVDNSESKGLLKM